MPEAITHAMGRVRHIHFVGIGGAGMSGIAEVLHNLGYVVSGSDIKESDSTQHLKELGIYVLIDHDSKHINGSDVVVVSSAVSNENPELIAARKQRIPVVPRAEMLAELMRFRHGIAVAGTHGKTTTTSLIASILAEAGLDPTYVIGGRLNSSGSHAKLGSGKYLVAEADESDASFLHLQPVISVLTNIDADHLETYGGNYQSLKSNFIEFLHHLPFYGLAVLCADDRGISEILDKLVKPFVTFGIEQEADVSATNIEYHQSKTFFTVSRRDHGNRLNINLNLPGKHNVLNALAAISVASQLEVPDDIIIHALEKFQGIARRCEVLGDIEINNKSVLIIDDYAHHPSEITAILEAIKNGWSGRRILVVFQPHRFSRTRDLFDDFCLVLSNMDILILLNIYAAGEEPIAGIDSRALCRAIRMRGKVEPFFIEDRNELHSLLPKLVSNNDILLVLGAGDIGSLGEELLTRYGKHIH